MSMYLNVKDTKRNICIKDSLSVQISNSVLFNMILKRKPADPQDILVYIFQELYKQIYQSPLYFDNQG